MCGRTKWLTHTQRPTRCRQVHDTRLTTTPNVNLLSNNKCILCSFFALPNGDWRRTQNFHFDIESLNRQRKLSFKAICLTAFWIDCIDEIRRAALYANSSLSFVFPSHLIRLFLRIHIFETRILHRNTWIMDGRWIWNSYNFCQKNEIWNSLFISYKLKLCDGNGVIHDAFGIHRVRKCSNNARQQSA